MMVVVITILSGSLRINDLTNIKLLEHCLEHGKGDIVMMMKLKRKLYYFAMETMWKGFHIIVQDKQANSESKNHGIIAVLL